MKEACQLSKVQKKYVSNFGLYRVLLMDGKTPKAVGSNI